MMALDGPGRIDMEQAWTTWPLSKWWEYYQARADFIAMQKSDQTGANKETSSIEDRPPTDPQGTTYRTIETFQ